MEHLKSATQNSLHYGLDTHGVGGSQVLSVGAFGPGPGKLVVLLKPDDSAQAVRGDVVVQRESLTFITFCPIGI